MSSRVELDGRRLVLRVLDCQMLLHTCAISMINSANRTWHSHAFDSVLLGMLHRDDLLEGSNGGLQLTRGYTAGNNVLRL